MTRIDFSSELKLALCESFAVRQDSPGHWPIRSPLVFEDGDNLPSFVSLVDGSWCLTDHGMTVSHLFFDEFQFTEARFNRISQLVLSHSAKFAEHHEIVLPLDAPPTAYDVGLFLQLVAQVQGVALTSRSDREQSRYVTTVRQSLESRLASADYDENWAPPALNGITKATYRADLRMGSDTGPDVVLFAASTSDKANVSALTMGQFRKVDRELVPILVYRPDRVASEAIYRFQDEVDEVDAVVAVEPGSYRELFGALERRGVELTSVE